MLGIAALFGGIGSLYLALSNAARFILDHNDCRMDCGFPRVPPMLIWAAIVIFFGISK